MDQPESRMPPPGTPAQPVHTPPSAPSATDPNVALRMQLLALDQRGRIGANWFYWVAGLSLVNSVVLQSGGHGYFVIGLGITVLVDTFTGEMAKQSPDIATTLKALALGFDVVAAAIVAGFGWLARNRYLAVYAIGMFLYLLDGLLFLLFQDWLSVGFHAFALFCMGSGFAAFRKLDAMERSLTSQALPRA